MSVAPKLLIVINDVDYFRLHWLVRASAARSEGYEVHVATSFPNNGAAEFEQEGITCHTIPINRRGVNLIRELWCLMSLYRLYRTLSPSIVHNITIKPVIYGGIAARLAAVPAVVSSIPGLGSLFVADRSLLRRLLQSLIRIGYRVALGHGNMRVIFENGDDQDELVRFGVVARERTLVIKGAGVNMDVFNPRREETGVPIIVLAARMLWDKGVEEFVAAAKQLRSEGVAARFVLVGWSDPGSFRAISSEQLQQWHEQGDIEWWGKRSDMPDVLAQANIVCLPSYYREGIPRILIEAAACGRAIVTTDVVGCREIVHDGENGLLVSPRDIAQLAEALRILINDPDRRRTMGERGRIRALVEFSETHVVRGTLNVYKILLCA